MKEVENKMKWMKINIKIYFILLSNVNGMETDDKIIYFSYFFVEIIANNNEKDVDDGGSRYRKECIFFMGIF